ncbi:MAG: AgmX/PglI C-terminal domain-containing protein, partial [Kofleriaceae bacterium]
RWWIAEASYRGPTRGGSVAPPVRAAAAFAPGVGPALKCTIGGEPGAPRYTCLRLIAEPANVPIALAKPRPKPIATIAITGKTAHNKSSLSAAAVAGKIAASYVPAIRRCYSELLRKKPSAGGALQLDFTVNAVGKLSEPGAKAADAALEPVASCVRDAMAAWQFAIPQSEYGEPRTARFGIALRLAPPAP